VAGEPGSIPGLLDDYHGLLVGPCHPNLVARETACPLVEEVHVPGEDGFDCTYEEWAELLRQEVIRAAVGEPKGLPDPSVLLSPEQQAEADLAQNARGVLETGDGGRIKPCPDAWVVIDGQGDVLTDPEKCLWEPEATDLSPPSLVFATAAEAYAARVYTDLLG
jgi:hypothetical protein